MTATNSGPRTDLAETVKRLRELAVLKVSFMGGGAIQVDAQEALSVIDALEGLEAELAKTVQYGGVLVLKRETSDRVLATANARITSLESSLAEARKGARTKGTVEVCPTCKREWATMHPDDKARCPGVNPFGDSPCPVRAAQHPIPSQGTTP